MVSNQQDDTKLKAGHPHLHIFLRILRALWLAHTIGPYLAEKYKVNFIYKHPLRGFFIS